MKWIPLFALLIISFSCEETDCCDIQPDDPLPNCIELQINNDVIKKPTIIKVQMLNDEYHYWINTGANAFDGDEFIVNNQCDTVCAYRGWIPDSCASNYTRSDWKAIW